MERLDFEAIRCFRQFEGVLESSLNPLSVQTPRICLQSFPGTRAQKAPSWRCKWGAGPARRRACVFGKPLVPGHAHAYFRDPCQLNFRRWEQKVRQSFILCLLYDSSTRSWYQMESHTVFPAFDNALLEQIAGVVRTASGRCAGVCTAP